MKRIWIYLFISLVLSACATTYHEYQGTTGYMDNKVADDEFLISYSANIHTSFDLVRTFAKQRAAELTLANGYSHFHILSSEENKKPCPCEGDVVMVKVVNIHIQCLNGKATDETINANDFLQSIKVE